MKTRQNKPPFLKGIGELKTEMLKKGVTHKDIQQSIEKHHDYKISLSAISVILDDKICDLVKNEADMLCQLRD
ncbi:MAG TPA: hypothetical protein DCM40_25370 [Maribacter sp.]|nr:hypothetical protein [Maribacter sp.]